MPATKDSLRALLAPVVAATGWELDELSLSPAGRRSVLRITVDGDVGIDLDGVADVSRAVSTALDDADAFGSRPYVLEVSSPGVERPLTEARHWRRAAGRLVEVVLRDGIPGGDSALVGRLVDVGDTAVTVETDGGRRELTYLQIARARVQVEFRRPDAGGPGDPGPDEDDPDVDDTDDTDDTEDLEDTDTADDDAEADDGPDDDDGDEGDVEDAGTAPDAEPKGGTSWTST